MTPARIEAAARAYQRHGMVGALERMRPSDEIVAAMLAAAYPELAAGTHWLAPMEATDTMWEVEHKEHDGLTTFPAQHWESLRLAYQKEHQG